MLRLGGVGGCGGCKDLRGGDGVAEEAGCQGYG